MLRRILLLVLAGWLGVITWSSGGPASATGPVVFTHGVASGDVTSTTAIVWTRIDVAETITAQVDDDPGFGTLDFSQAVVTAAASDFTAKVDATGLTPNTVYYYRWHHDNAGSDQFSPTGTFKTAPDENASIDVSFAYSGDSDGTTTNVAPAFPQDFATLDLANADNPDFFVYLGDTIYSDSGLRNNLPDPPGPGPATTVEQYREAYQMNRSIQALPDLLESTSIYAQPDDHEVQNDYSGETVDQTRYDNGRQAFLEYMPVRETGLLSDASCAGDPLYRTFRWGSEVEIFVLDERSCRNDDLETTCSSDLGPTFPSAVRTQSPFNVFLQPMPPAGCLAALNDGNRTMLGPVQKAQFKADLLASDARFKFVVSQLAVQQFHVLLYDRWEGYGAERTELLNYIRDNSVEDVIFLTTDNHANLMNEVAIDRFADPRTVAYELITGPIATNTLQTSVFNMFGQFGVDAFNTALGYSGTDCRDLDAISYGLLDIDAAAGTATATFKDDAGASVQNQATPPIASCDKVFPAPTLQILDCDVNGDAVCSVGDIGVVVGAFGSANQVGDLNADSQISVGDIGLVVGAFGLTDPTTNLPEGRLVRFFIKEGGPGTLTCAATDLPAGATFSTSCEFVWTPSPTQSGSYRVTFSVSNGTATEIETLPITVLDTMP
ncbi:MAG: alkaline phosphatase D family protein [Dehalococcoidia bacterium]